MFIATQLNSTQLDVELSSVELSCVAINGPLQDRTSCLCSATHNQSMLVLCGLCGHFDVQVLSSDPMLSDVGPSDVVISHTRLASE